MTFPEYPRLVGPPLREEASDCDLRPRAWLSFRSCTSSVLFFGDVVKIFPCRKWTSLQSVPRGVNGKSVPFAHLRKSNGFSFPGRAVKILSSSANARKLFSILNLVFPWTGFFGTQDASYVLYLSYLRTVRGLR